ncbi:MAG: dihydrolipoyl dehydrogenase [Acidiferrobacterales bacterium]|nr:dihydrolipoyl dehydrogenase [Acidiferrobacterales bacterium]
MEIPASEAGVVKEVLLRVGDEISEGDLILRIDSASTDSKNVKAQPKDANSDSGSSLQSLPATAQSADSDERFDLVVLGSGPGGYTAAFRAADLGMKVALIERYPVIGGVCLNVGCIPSKALLHAAKVIDEAHHADGIGIAYSKPAIDLEKLIGWKNGVVDRLTGGLTGLAKQRKVNVLNGYGRFVGSHQIEVKSAEETVVVDFKQAVIAVGSTPVKIPGFPHDDPRVIDSTGALQLDDIPERLLILGGGIIGLEMATVYRALGSKVSVVEMMSQLMVGADPDMVRPLLKIIKKQYEAIWTSTKVTAMVAEDSGIRVEMTGDKAPESALFDKVLVAVGRKPNGHAIAAPEAGVEVDDKGFIRVDAQMRTNVPHIFAIGDVVGQPMLAHKAVHEGKVAAEVAAGQKSGFDARVIPSVAYTDPEVAWVGLTETEAKEEGISYEKGIFPWAASGRALSQERSEGITKLLFNPDNHQLLGAAITGTNAGDLIAEAALAIEMGADAADIALTIHAHPTVAETIGFAAEAFEGTITDLYMPKKKPT